MILKRLAILSLACLLSTHVVADPIHAKTDGAYWHHASGWVFPRAIGEFELVGIPQDVAGSEDAVAYYARVINGARVTVSVDLYAPGSANTETKPAGATENLTVDESRALSATRIVDANAARDELTGTYFVTAGDWRVKIRISGLAITEPIMDAFVLAQRWDTLTSVPTPR